MPVADTRPWYATKRVILPGIAISLLLIGGLASAAASGGPDSTVTPLAGTHTSASTVTTPDPGAAAKAAAAKAAADKAAADKAAADKAAADKAAADKAAADKAAADKAVPLTSSDPSSGLRDYANCKELNGDYPHGVGRSGAVDKVSGGGSGVTNFTRNDELYALNSESDGDNDGIACEKR